MPLYLQRDHSLRSVSPFSPAELTCIMEAMLAAAGLRGAAVELALLDDDAMEKLHKQSLGCDGPTNILSFPAAVPNDPGGAEHGPDSPGPDAAPPPPPNPMRYFLGSLALSLDTLRRECFFYGQSPEEHCIRLLAHGLAHLLGHDHSPAMSALAEQLEQAGAAAAQGYGAYHTKAS